jgi:hypothetical protein
MGVVVVLARVVEERRVLAEGALHHVLEALVFPLSALEEVIARVHIGGVVLVVVKFERLLRHVGRERIMRIREIGE